MRFRAVGPRLPAGPPMTRLPGPGRLALLSAAAAARPDRWSWYLVDVEVKGPHAQQQQLVLGVQAGLVTSTSSAPALRVLIHGDHFGVGERGDGGRRERAAAGTHVGANHQRRTQNAPEIELCPAFEIADAVEANHEHVG